MSQQSELYKSLFNNELTSSSSTEPYCRAIYHEIHMNNVSLSKSKMPMAET